MVANEHPRPVNVARVTKPRWMTSDHEPREQYDFVILISRGDPRRSDDQMHDAALEQLRAWQLRFNPQDAAQVADLAAAVIATEHIFPTGSQAVQINRELLEVYLAKARKAAAAA